MNAPLVLVNGWPGVGKDTVAETLVLMLGDDKASLVDWSKAQKETFQTIPSDDVVAQRNARDECFAEQVEHPSTLKKVVICTDCLPDTPEGRRLAQDFEVVANRCNRLLVPIYLECHVEENMRRIANSERRVSMKDKSMLPSVPMSVSTCLRPSPKDNFNRAHSPALSTPSPTYLRWVSWSHFPGHSFPQARLTDINTFVSTKPQGGSNS